MITLAAKVEQSRGLGGRSERGAYRYRALLLPFLGAVAIHRHLSKSIAFRADGQVDSEKYAAPQCDRPHPLCQKKLSKIRCGLLDLIFQSGYTEYVRWGNETPNAKGMTMIATETKSYRGRHDGSALMGENGCAMFADNLESIASYSGHNGQIYSVDHSRLTPVGDLTGAIATAWANDDFRPYGYDHLEAEEILATFDPANIVNCAEAYDDAKLVTWLWEQVLEARNILGVKTQDGAVVFDASIVD